MDCQELGYLALAVVQAGAYILTSGGLRGYLGQYKKRRMKLLEGREVQRSDDYKLTVYTTWQISFEKLSERAVKFLQLCAFLHRDNIREEIFARAATNPKGVDYAKQIGKKPITYLLMQQLNANS